MCSCVPSQIQYALADLPDTLDETYQRTLQNINNAHWEFAHRLFQFVAVASRPLRVEELAELLAFDFKAGPIPKFDEDCRLEDPVDAVLSTCSSLLAIVDVQNPSGKVIQFSHFSVKEYLTSPRLAEANDIIPRRYHVSMTPAHTLAAQICLGILLHLDEDVVRLVTRENLEQWPLAEYAAKHWADHALFEGVSQNVEDGLKELFDPGESHLAVCVWIHDPSYKYRIYERPVSPLRTSLHYAAYWGLHFIVEFLVIECSQNVCSGEFIDNLTPLHLASERGHVKICRMLIEHGASVMTQDRVGKTPLHLASEEGQVEVARVLIQHGADVAAQDNHGETPLLLAATWGQEELVRMLIEHGVDVAAQDKNGITPLHLASQFGFVEVVRMLIERGADVAAQDKNGRTPLHQALQSRNVEVVRILIERGADVVAQDKDGRTPLHRASQSKNVEVVRMLIERGADVAAQNRDGTTPLHLASAFGREGPVRMLIERGADVAAPEKNGRTPLHQALQSRNVEVVRMLIERGADVAAQDKDGRTPLHRASQSQSVEAVCMLIERGADLEAQTKDGETPLHLAAKNGGEEAVRMLIERGADVEAQTKDGETPLHLASRPVPYDFQIERLAKVSRILLEQGADVNARNKHGLTPFYLASRSKNAEDSRAQVLLRHGADPSNGPGVRFHRNSIFGIFD